MRTLTNIHDVPLILAVWLLNDEYDYVQDNNYISATSILKPLKSIILSKRVMCDESLNVTYDIADLVASKFGTGIHDSVEKAWTTNYKKALQLLKVSGKSIENVKINPTKEELTKDTIPVYIEQRLIKEFKDLGYKIGGKFDFVVDGALNDIKTTSVYTYINDSKKDDYIAQGSIYRWLNPELITEDTIKINFVFTDWSKAKSQYTEGYPSSRIAHRSYKLWSLEETEDFIRNKIKDIIKYTNEPEDNMPRCTDEELWRSETSYKYYSGTDTSGRCSKRFDSMEEALKHKVTKGKGTIVMEPGKVNRCLYCSAAPICKQRLEYFEE